MSLLIKGIYARAIGLKAIAHADQIVTDERIKR